MRNDILERRDEIVGWLENSDHLISKREICRRLECRIDTLESYLKKMNIEYAGNQGTRRLRTVSDDQWFTENSVRSNNCIRKRILNYNLIAYECRLCDVIDSWNGSEINLHLDHINGDNRDNRLDNLRFLCPNCHSQTDTYCAGNITNKGMKKVSDEDLLAALNEHPNIRKALMAVGLSPKGGNYHRCHRLQTEGLSL